MPDFDDFKEIIVLYKDVLFLGGVILFVLGILLFFVPNIFIRWNAWGNLWLGSRWPKPLRRFFMFDYPIFYHHRVIGGIMWGFSALFLLIYTLY